MTKEEYAKRETVLRRYDDMSGGRSYIQMVIQDDGDACLMIYDHEREQLADVEFCTPMIGGGRSPNINNALHQLAIAIEKDGNQFE